jgi:hypothetical protein
MGHFLAPKGETCRRIGVSACNRSTRGQRKSENGTKDIREGSETGKIQFLVYSKPFKTFVTFSDLCDRV